MAKGPALLALIVVGIAVASGPSRQRGVSRIVRLTFTRSGGIVAAPGMTIEATVDLDERAGRVVSSDGAYVRDLSTEEAGRIRGMVDPVRFVGLKSDLHDSRRSGADRYQFDISATFADGRHKTVTLSDGEDPRNLDALSPGLGRLLAWISQESERIWNQRIKNR